MVKVIHFSLVQGKLIILANITNKLILCIEYTAD